MGTPEGNMLRSMGGDMAVMAMEIDGIDLRRIVDPEPFLIIKELKRVSEIMKRSSQISRGDLNRVLERLDRCEKNLRSKQYIEWQQGLSQDISKMSLALGNVDDYEELDDFVIPDINLEEDDPDG